MELAAGFGRDVDGVDLDGRRSELVDPSGDSGRGPPLCHHGQLLGHGRADHLEDCRNVVENDLVSHPGRDDFSGELGRIHVLEVEVQVDPTAGELQRLRERQDPRAGESPGELRAGIEGTELRQRAIAHRPGAVRRRLELAIVEEDVMSVPGDPDVDLDPLHAIGDGELQGPRGVLGRLAHPAPMGHHLDRSRRLDRLEEWEARMASFRRRARGPEQDPPGEYDRSDHGHDELSSLIGEESSTGVLGLGGRSRSPVG